MKILSLLTLLLLSGCITPICPDKDCKAPVNPPYVEPYTKCIGPTGLLAYCR